MKLLKNKIFILIFLSSLIFVYGCYNCSCHCNYCLGCKIVTITRRTDDSLLVQKKFCSQTNIYTNQPLQDSITKFKNKYYGNSYYKVNERDSTYNCDSFKYKDCDRATPQDYMCECAK
jgi:hypothetical protein